MCHINLPHDQVLLVQQEHYVGEVEEESPAGQTKQQEDQQDLLDDDSNTFQVVTAKHLSIVSDIDRN